MALVTRVFLDAARDGNLMPFLAFACAHACGVLQCPRVLRFDLPSSAHVHEHGLRCMFCHTQCVRQSAKSCLRKCMQSRDRGPREVVLFFLFMPWLIEWERSHVVGKRFVGLPDTCPKLRDVRPSRSCACQTSCKADATGRAKTSAMGLRCVAACCRRRSGLQAFCGEGRNS